MLILFMDRKGMLLTHAVPRGQTVNSEYMYYSKVINIIITFEINELIIFPVNLIIGYYTAEMINTITTILCYIVISPPLVQNNSGKNT